MNHKGNYHLLKQIHQVVMNLATNSYHAMKDTGGELKVNLREIQVGERDIMGQDLDPGTYARLTVADTGIGMEKEIMGISGNALPIPSASTSGIPSLAAV